MVSDESEQTVTHVMEIVKDLPSDAFFGSGPNGGPDVFMIDDSTVVKNTALSTTWPSANVPLCTFHFLQQRWTWLYEGKNNTHKDDRITLIQLIRKLVYSNSETATSASPKNTPTSCSTETKNAGHTALEEPL